MDKIKVYIKCKDKKCVFCHQDIIMKDIVDDKIEISITRRKISMQFRFQSIII